MKSKQFAQELKSLVLQLKDEKGITEIKSDKLVAYLDEILKSPNEEISDLELEKYKAELQLWIEQNRAVQNSNLEMFKSIILYGQLSLKSSMLLNGGAAIALLAYIGHLTTNPTTIKFVSSFSGIMAFYLSGAFLVTLAYGSTYLTQVFYGYNNKHRKKAIFFHLLSCVITVLSYIAFIIGSYDGYSILKDIFS